MWGYGASVIAVPGSSEIVLSLPPGGPRTSWCVADLDGGHVRRGTGMPGGLRSIVFPARSAEASRPRALATFGLCRLELTVPAIESVVRDGIGKYQSTMVDFDDDLLALGNHRAPTMLLVDRRHATPVKRLRAPGSNTI